VVVSVSFTRTVAPPSGPSASRTTPEITPGGSTGSNVGVSGSRVGGSISSVGVGGGTVGGKVSPCVAKVAVGATAVASGFGSAVGFDSACAAPEHPTATKTKIDTSHQSFFILTPLLYQPVLNTQSSQPQRQSWTAAKSTWDLFFRILANVSCHSIQPLAPNARRHMGLPRPAAHPPES